MASVQRQCDTLKEIIHKSSIRFIFPQCLQGFPRSDLLYRHFRAEEDEVHAGLSVRDTDFKRFLSCYQKALRASIPAEKLPFDSKRFDVLFIVQHYGQDTESQYTSPDTTRDSAPVADPMLISNRSAWPHELFSLSDIDPVPIPSNYLSQGEITHAESNTMGWNNWSLGGPDDTALNEH
ncbi:hypothetical protein EYZ11_011439 [Aspergillus tanneri]|uniref:Uncharacterized protein n=1 Tax=Aspergillus tanneri TaxID=1220188 RepID=A0A4S3J3F3_9EURO|nr:uncharacterized protein ATNIH1004_001678 [Aspergillus tanneri]KAA8652773.1 hypothetical protein ATNIH1004_001678 [Aspergillus tanneri]THC89112.1 hypothetical protein EYZ11_011439 [Aspergillus tanneri]